MTDDRRPVNRDDLVRILMVLHAVSARVGGEHVPLYEALHDQHADHPELLSRRFDEEEMGEAFLAREFHHALLVLESLAWHDGQVPAEERPAPSTVCAKPGCPHLAAWQWCVGCELEHLANGGARSVSGPRSTLTRNGRSASSSPSRRARASGWTAAATSEPCSSKTAPWCFMSTSTATDP